MIEEREPSTRRTAGEYFAMLETGLLSPDDRVELLDGIIVSMSPQQPRHAATVWRIHGRLASILGDRAIVRSQMPLVLASRSVPEPDITVVPFRIDDYATAHPDRAHLVIEVSDSSLPQDRLTKSRIYASAGVEDYWVVNLRSNQVERSSSPDPGTAVYRERGIADGEERLPATSLGLLLRACDLFPSR
jgi:Uma2 family endonuclease